jgi:uncharacterized alpha-E superfamily protein
VISRVAESSFWLQRYLERMEATARVLMVMAAGGPVAGREVTRRWAPVLIVSGEYPNFVALYGEEAADDTETVLRYLTWELACGVSIRSSLQNARENARTIRETVSREGWESVNRLWLWLESDEAHAMAADDPVGFYRTVRDGGHQCRGAIVATMPDDETLHFMTLGMYLERADQTARLLDVHHHAIAPEGADDSVDDVALWVQVLLACGAYETFFKRNRKALRGYRVARFLLLDTALPRSVRHCVWKAAGELSAIEALGGDTRPLRARVLLERMWARLNALHIESLVADDVHTELTAIVDGLAQITTALYGDYFAPATAGSSSP